jgi:hypothetical protein
VNNGGNGKIIRLTAERLRRLEQRMAAVEEAQHGTNARLDETNARLDQAVDVLTRLVRVVAAQNDRMNRNFALLNGRLDRMTRAILKGRTGDQRRMMHLERRVDVLERRVMRSNGS